MKRGGRRRKQEDHAADNDDYNCSCCYGDGGGHEDYDAENEELETAQRKGHRHGNKLTKEQAIRKQEHHQKADRGRK